MPYDNQVQVVLLFFAGLDKLTIHAVHDFRVGRVQCYRINLFDNDLNLWFSYIASFIELLLTLFLEIVWLGSFLLFLVHLLDLSLLNLALYLHFFVYLAFFILLLCTENQSKYRN